MGAGVGRPEVDLRAPRANHSRSIPQSLWVAADPHTACTARAPARATREALLGHRVPPHAPFLAARAQNGYFPPIGPLNPLAHYLLYYHPEVLDR